MKSRVSLDPIPFRSGHRPSLVPIVWHRAHWPLPKKIFWPIEANSFLSLMEAASNFSTAGGMDAICGIPRASNEKPPSTIATKATTRMKRACTKRRIAPPNPRTLNPIVCSSLTSVMRCGPSALIDESPSPSPCDGRLHGFLHMDLPGCTPFLLPAEGGDPEDECDHQTEQKGIQRHESRCIAPYTCQWTRDDDRA